MTKLPALLFAKGLTFGISKLDIFESQKCAKLYGKDLNYFVKIEL